MIGDRPTKPMWIALVCDPALSMVDDRVMKKYADTRDIKILEPDLNTDDGVYVPSGKKVSMVKIKPLVAEKSNLREYGLDGLRKIVQTHIIAVKNLGSVRVRQIEDGFSISDGDMEKLDDKVCMEIAKVIIDLGDGSDGIERPFSLPDTLRGDRKRYRQLSANIALLENANLKGSSSEDQPKTDPQE